jgi:phosphatidylcholine synthase
VKQVLPYFDGTRLDDLVDYFTYTIVPALFMLWTDLLPPAIAVPLACAVGPRRARTSSRARTRRRRTTTSPGFPSYWNILAFYLYALGWPTAANAAAVAICVLLVFVPDPLRLSVRASRTMRALTVGLGIVWAVVTLIVLGQLFRDGVASRALVLGSLLYPAYYVGLSLVMTLRRVSR